jgi:phage baseplate assembly protein W
MTESLSGRGLGFPLRLGVAGLAESTGVTRIEESIRTILGTGYGERVMRPRFGCNLKSLAFAPNNDATANLARYYVTEGLTRWEPRIASREVLRSAPDRPSPLRSARAVVPFRLATAQRLAALGIDLGSGDSCGGSPRGRVALLGAERARETRDLGLKRRFEHLALLVVQPIGLPHRRHQGTRDRAIRQLAQA